MALLTLLGAAGMFNGLSLASDPTGRSLGLNVEMLPSWHTWDYRISGVFVLIFLGLAPLVCAAAVLVDNPEAAVFVACIGSITVGWVLWQIVILDIYAPRAQIPLAVLGVALFTLAAGELRKRSHDRNWR